MTSIHDRAAAAGCPMSDFAVAPSRPAGSYHEKVLNFRDGGPIWLSTQAQGFWMLTQRELVHEMLVTPEIFSTESISPQEPNQHFTLIPGNIDPPEHKAYRAILNPWFSPKTIRAAEPRIREIARTLVEGFAANGSVDASRDYCLPFSTGAFIERLGLPPEHRAQFMEWVNDWFRGFSGEEGFERDDGQQPRFEAAIVAVNKYMADVVEDRRSNPRDPATDLITGLVQYRIDGRPLDEEELKGYTLLLFLGGMDSPAAAMSWLFYRLAQRPEERRRLVENPELIPLAVEESLRFDTVVMGAGRKVAQDATWHGVELRKGDMVWGLLNAANHDPRIYADPDTFSLERDATNLAFSGGIHRCVGSHFARSQLRIALEEFQRVIPDFELVPDVEVRERGVVMALDNVPVRWNLPVSIPAAGSVGG